MTAVLAPSRGASASHDRRAVPRLLRAAVPYVPAVVVGIGGWSHRWMDEDAFINLRVLDQLFAGHGPVFNAGERIEATTSPLWLAVLAVGRVLFGAFASMEWIAMLASLVAAIAAFVVGGRAAAVLHRGREGVVVPVGLLLVASVTVVWDFATSGLEMGLVWLWLAGSWLVLVSVARAGTVTGRGRIGGAAVIGLGPLVRPELGVVLVCLGVAWFVLVRPRQIGADVVAMFALPVAYQVFRMGYYASVVPSTALAKDAGGLHIGQGWSYAENFISPYHLWLSFALIAVVLAVRYASEHDRRTAVATTAMLAGGLLHGAYIVAIGGDYMHGRLLLPAFFAIGLPASLSVRREAGIAIALSALAAVWATVTVFAFDPPPVPQTILLSQVSDWRTVSGAKLKPDDTAFGLNGNEAAAAYRRGVRGYYRITDKQPRPAKDPDTFVATMGSIGVPAYDAGRNVWVVDIGGLAEPLAARTEPVPGRAAGHRKQVDEAWYDARFGAGTGSEDDKVAAARRALACGPVSDLLAAVDDELTPGRFVANIWHSFRLTRLKVPADPRVAAAKWCGSGESSCRDVPCRPTAFVRR